MNLFVRNISQLVTVAARGERVKTGAAMRDLGIITDAGVLCRDGMIAWAGPMSTWRPDMAPEVPELDADGRVVLPGFVDSHTHMMFAGDRAVEFGLRAEGATYQEIAARGGGILNTMKAVRQATKKELKRTTVRYLNDMMRHGTTTVEIKSGYGLSLDGEIKMLEAMNEIAREEIATVVPTFIGAHAVPPEFAGNAAAYTDLVVEKMLPYAAAKRLALFCDVFCEQGYFDLALTERILTRARELGMRLKIHAEELQPLGGAELAGKLNAASADHLERVTAQGIAALRAGGVVATLLPGVSFTLNHGYAPARALIDAGVAVAIATDFNPGSCMSYSMPLMMTIACTQMKMTPEEVITAATLHGAAALDLADSCGSIETGKRADLIVTDVNDYRHLAYHFGVNHVHATIKNGTLLEF